MSRHDDPDRRIRAWLHDEAHGELPDWVLARTFDTTRSARQRHGLRGWLPSREGHIGSSTRRRTNVFALATVAAIAAGVLLATNAVLEPRDPLAPAAEAPVITTEAEMFNGSFAYGPSCVDEGGEDIDYCWTQAGVIFDDPRFQGSVTMRANPDYTDQGIYLNQFTITTDDGSWVGQPVPGILTSPDDGVPSVHLFTGDGAYEGLHAVATVDLEFGAFVVQGYVVHGGFPALP